MNTWRNKVSEIRKKNLSIEARFLILNIRQTECISDQKGEIFLELVRTEISKNTKDTSGKFEEKLRKFLSENGEVQDSVRRY